MTKIIRIKKGLNINLKGKAFRQVRLLPFPADSYSIEPGDLPGFIPKVAVKAGEKVQAGTIILYDKNHPELKITAPVSGEISAINRGERRKLLSVDIIPDKVIQYVDFGKTDISELSVEAVKSKLSNAGIFPFIKQRPYDIVANPQDSPRDIFITGFNSAPLAPDAELIMQGDDADFQTGLDVLSKLTTGKIYLGIRSECNVPCLKNAKNVELVAFEGPHPAGNVGVQINHIKPVNKGEIVWTLNYIDVPFIGRLFNRGIADFSRTIALTGSEVRQTGYYRSIVGANIRNLVENNITEKYLRFISGNVLTGKQIGKNGHLGFYDNQITVIPEGTEINEFFGWISPGINQFSASKTFLSSLVNLFIRKEYILDARIKGGKRAMIMSNQYDQVFPMDIYPEYLLKAIISFNIDKMENLGIYEVAPEDFALCEFVDTSKIEIQQIVRKGLDALYKEMN